VCRDIARKRGLRQATSIEDERAAGALDALASNEDVEARAIESERHALIAEALDQLPERERAALVLRDLEGLSTEEAARALGSSSTTVRSQISSARAKIKAFHDRLVKQNRRG
jgi:RNA polymerase sigma-70 factor (ECF subfamily)